MAAPSVQSGQSLGACQHENRWRQTASLFHIETPNLLALSHFKAYIHAASEFRGGCFVSAIRALQARGPWLRRASCPQH